MNITLEEYRALSLPGRQKTFLLWLSAQPKTTPYRYFDVEDCAMAQFGRAMINETVIADGVGFIVWKTRQHIRIFNKLSQERALMKGTTFGEATRNLSALI